MTQIVVDDEGQQQLTVLAEVQFVNAGMATVVLHQGVQVGINRTIHTDRIHNLARQAGGYRRMNGRVAEGAVRPGCFILACYADEGIHLTKGVLLPPDDVLVLNA